MKFLFATIVSFVCVLFLTTSFAADKKNDFKLAICTSKITQDDVIGVDHDKNGTPIEYKRNDEDVKKLLIRLNEKIKDDPSITKSKYWKKEMLTPKYWLLVPCGGTRDCGSKTCSNSNACSYGSIGMAGCRC